MKFIFLLNLALFQFVIFAQDMPQPPDCKKVPNQRSLFGKTLTDDYAWLKDRNSEEVLEYIKAENAYTEKMMKPTEKLRKKLYDEIIGRIKETDVSVPYKRRGYWYYTRTEKGKNYYVSCRKKDALSNKEEVLLDVNEIIKNKKYYGVYYFEMSLDNKVMAYFVDETGNFELDVYFKNLESNKDILDTLHAVTSLAWANDNKTIYYSTQDSITNRSYKVYKHILGQPSSKDQLIYHEKDSLYDIYVQKSKSEQVIFMGSYSSEQSEMSFLNANTPNAGFELIHKREKGHLYDVSHYNDKFYILSNKNAKNLKLVVTDTASPAMENWIELISHREDVMLESIDIFNDYLVVSENHKGLYNLRVIEWNSKAEHYIPFDEEVYTVYASTNLDFDTKKLRFTYVSLKIPYSVYEYNMETKERTLLKQKEVLGGYDPDNYQSERLWATGNDGTKIPVSIVYKKGLKRDGKNPLYIEGYGAYGSSSSANFSTTRLDFLERDFIFAIAHVRGGSDLGRQWYEDGKLLKKKNTFTDFIACVEHLIDSGYTSAGLVSAHGASAGGLLAGAVVNMKPELFKVVIMDVPFVDVINTMLDPNMPLTTQEYEEWGNPAEEKYFEYILSYSPYDNVAAQNYPNMLFLTGMTDEQVSFWEPAKMVAKLRDLKTDNNKLLLKVALSSGHGGVSGRYNTYKEIAFVHAFILSMYGINE